MGLNKPTKPAWAYGDSLYVIEPPLGHKNTGWKSKQKPPFQYMNWIQLKNYQWQNWSEERAEFLESVSFHTAGGSVTWSGADIVVPAGGLVIEWRARDLLISNILPEATYALADGEYLVFIPHETPDHVLTLGTYATLVPGQYAIIASSDFVDNLNYTEVILFKRRGAVVGTAILEVPLFKTAVQSGGALASNDLLVHHHTDADDGGVLEHHNMNGLADDDHTQYAHLNKASQTFLQTISGQTPTASGHFATKGYVDGLIPSMTHVCEDNVAETVSAGWTFSAVQTFTAAPVFDGTASGTTISANIKKPLKVTSVSPNSQISANDLAAGEGFRAYYSGSFTASNHTLAISDLGSGNSKTYMFEISVVHRKDSGEDGRYTCKGWIGEDGGAGYDIQKTDEHADGNGVGTPNISISGTSLVVTHNASAASEGGIVLEILRIK